MLFFYVIFLCYFFMLFFYLTYIYKQYNEFTYFSNNILSYMKIKSVIKGFTLIELLVVITIIGILATGATTVYTSQIQKARDSTRTTDIWAIQQAVEQVYQDNAEYPHADQFLTWTTNTTVSTYMEKIPWDKKNGQTCNNSNWATDCWYSYKTEQDSNGISYWAYEISTAYENQWNVTKKWWWDDGNDNARLEIGTMIKIVSTSVATLGITSKKWACTLWGISPTAWTDQIIINGSALTLGNWCN